MPEDYRLCTDNRCSRNRGAHRWHDLDAEIEAALADGHAVAPIRPRDAADPRACAWCGLFYEIRGCTPEKCTDEYMILRSVIGPVKDAINIDHDRKRAAALLLRIARDPDGAKWRDEIHAMLREIGISQ